MKKPKAFNLYLDNARQVSMLDDVQAGRLIKALFLHANGEQPEDLSNDLALNLMYSMISAQIDRDFIKYEEICEKRRAAGRASAEKRNNAGSQAEVEHDTADIAEDSDTDNSPEVELTEDDPCSEDTQETQDMINTETDNFAEIFLRLRQQHEQQGDLCEEKYY